jgi:hypothetical protein
MEAVHIAQRITGDNRTDVINRAVQLYATVLQLKKEGAKLSVERDGKLSEIIII